MCGKNRVPIVLLGLKKTQMPVFTKGLFRSNKRGECNKRGG
jgi:hypothetical protein